MVEESEELRLVTALEKTLRSDVDGSIHTALFKQLEEISFRLDAESKKLLEKEIYLQIEGARQAVNGAIATMRIVVANIDSTA